MKKEVRKLLWAVGGMILTLNGIVAQQQKVDRADRKYDRYEYVDAQKMYEKVAAKGFRNADLLKKLGNSYYFNSQFNEALKWYEELVNTYPNEVEPEYLFRYAQTLRASERYNEADVTMQKFAIASGSDQRGKLFVEEPDYLKRIDFQSGRFKIDNVQINSELVDFGTSFFKSKHIVFSSSRDTLRFRKNVHQWNNESFLDLYSAAFDPKTGELSDLKKFGGNLNTRFHESTPVFTKDGSTIYFTRNNSDGKNLGKDAKGTNKLKIYRAYKNSQGNWTTPMALPFTSDEYSVAHPALSSDEKILYFTSDMPGGKGQSDLYKVAINEEGNFGEPENLGDRINTEGKETFPFVSKEGDFYFASDGRTGLGGLDIYVTQLEPTTDEEKLIVNIGKPVNSSSDDFAFIVDDESKLGFFSSNRAGGKGKDDVYRFVQIEDLKSFCEIQLKGVITDKDTGEPLVGAVVTVLDGSNTVVQTFKVGADASYSLEVTCNTDYFVRAEKEGYITEEKLATTPGETSDLDVSIALESKVKKVDKGDDLAKILALNIIYFDFDKYTIRKDAEVELAKVIQVLKDHPEMKIEIGSHTDSRGDDAYNLWLSEKRAQATKEYIITKGAITADRLSSKGYGETKPVNNCGNASNCTMDEYQKNRRSEFIIK